MNEKRELRTEIQQNPGSEILKDLRTHSAKSKEELEKIMSDRYGKNWEKKLEKARKANLKK